jgi:hypothetical protein
MIDYDDEAVAVAMTCLAWLNATTIHVISSITSSSCLHRFDDSSINRSAASCRSSRYVHTIATASLLLTNSHTPSDAQIAKISLSYRHEIGNH